MLSADFFYTAGSHLAVHATVIDISAFTENPGQGCQCVLGKMKAQEGRAPKIRLQAMQSVVSSCT